MGSYGGYFSCLSRGNVWVISYMIIRMLFILFAYVVGFIVIYQSVGYELCAGIFCVLLAYNLENKLNEKVKMRKAKELFEKIKNGDVQCDDPDCTNCK